MSHAARTSPSAPRVVITGASTGIGHALAKTWAARGASVVLCARDEARLTALASEIEAAGGRAFVVAGDVTDDAHRTKLVAEAARLMSGIDVLVNNAGRGFYAPFSAIDLDELRGLFELNVFAPLRLSQLAAPHLERSRGAVVMMSSVAGVLAPPKYAAYSASKFALEALSMAMRAELAEKGVRVVVVRPGPVATPFRANATRTAGADEFNEPAKRAEPPEHVALVTIRAVERGNPVVETSAFVRLAGAISRLSPGSLRVVMRSLARKSAPRRNASASEKAEDLKAEEC